MIDIPATSEQTEVDVLWEAVLDAIDKMNKSPNWRMKLEMLERYERRMNEWRNGVKAMGLKERFRNGLISREDAVKEAEAWDNAEATERFIKWINGRKAPKREG
jgi:hypothetical protein